MKDIKNRRKEEVKRCTRQDGMKEEKKKEVN